MRARRGHVDPGGHTRQGRLGTRAAAVAVSLLAAWAASDVAVPTSPAGTALVAYAAATADEAVTAAEFHQAVWRGQTKAVRHMLTRGVGVDATDAGRDTRAQWTALHWAAYTDQLAVARVLVAANATVDAKDENGYTPLHLSAVRANVDMATLLLRAGADLDATTADGRPAAALLPNRGTPDVTQAALRGADAYKEALGAWPASWHGFLASIDALGQADKLASKGFESFEDLIELKPTREFFRTEMGLTGYQAKMLALRAKSSVTGATLNSTWRMWIAFILMFMFVFVQRCFPKRPRRRAAAAESSGGGDDSGNTANGKDKQS